ncbi:MAG: three-Cys-motif partner protein TcmP [Solirubrobacterales bacterium]
MARKPKGSHWDRDGRTEAKHRVLVEYLKAWIPIFGLQRRVKDLVLIDGFAGPGRYTGGELGSPLLMVEAYSDHQSRDDLEVTAHFFFIEMDQARAGDLQAEIDKLPPAPDIAIRVVPGDYADMFPAVLDEARSSWPNAPIFAFIDPFGADVHPELAGNLLRFPRCEVLLFVPLGYFADFFDAPDMRDTLEAVFGLEVFERCSGLSAAERRTALVEMIEARLSQSCRWVRAFEIAPSGGGGRTHFLFFGTNDKTGLARMKTAMWKLDPVTGLRYRDSTRPHQSILFEPEPDIAPLRRELEARFIDEPFSIEEALDFTLCETPFLHDRHLKKQTLAAAEREGRLVPVDPKPGRRKNTYPSGTRMRFVTR